MKNTKITFFWTYIEHSTFYKAIFEAVIEGRPFESMVDAEQWEEDNTDVLLEVYGPGAGNIIFDRKVIKYANTTKAPFNPTVKRLIEGELIFPETRKKKDTTPEVRCTKAVVEETTIDEHASCWIDPFGEQHNMFGVAMHNEFASDILIERNLMTLEDLVDDHRYPYEILQDLGWVRILGWTTPVTFIMPTRMNVSQTRAVKDYCLSEKISFPDKLKW